MALGGHADRDATVHPPGPSIALDHWAVRPVVTAAGVALFAVAAWSIYRGLRTRFLDDLRAGTPRIVIRLGQAGYVGRGVTFCILGGMLIWSAVGHHVGPAELRTVFRLINISPTGEPRLLLEAAGLGLFGAYCLTWAAHRRR